MEKNKVIKKAKIRKAETIIIVKKILIKNEKGLIKYVQARSSKKLEIITIISKNKKTERIKRYKTNCTYN